VEKTFADGGIHFSEQTVRKRTGEPIEVVVYTDPVKDHLGQTFAVMEMSTEVTHIKTLQRELASLGQAVAITAHAIKNILMGLVGGAYMVQSALRRQDMGLAHRCWEIIREGVELSSTLVQDVLLVSRHREPDPSEVDPWELASQVLRVFTKKAQDLGVELRLEPPCRRTTLWCDPKAIHTAPTNLVANALDACSSGSTSGLPMVILRVGVSEDGAGCGSR
jgi:signal transduction histidine kinase